MVHVHIYVYLVCGLVCGGHLIESEMVNVSVVDNNVDSIAEAVRQHVINIGVRIVLNLDLNDITKLLPSTFKDRIFQFVVGLDLSHNKLETIVHGQFDGLYNLIHIDISYNNLRSVDRGAFINLNKLERINLRNNQLTRLPSGLLGTKRKETRLVEFDASFNNISSIDNEVFHANLSSLLYVRLSHNSLRAFEPWPYLPGIRIYERFKLKFDLRWNMISRFENSIGWKKTREPNVNVDLRFNNFRLFRISDFMDYMPGGNLTVYDIGILGLQLKHNPWFCECGLHAAISIIKDSFLMRKGFDFLNCQSPDELKGHSLGYFVQHPEKLVCNVTEHCPRACLCQSIPEYGYIMVDCHDPQTFTTLPETLPSGKLALNFSGNQLEEIPRRSYLKNVVILDLSRNRLKRFDDSILKQFKSITTLVLNENTLTTLPPGVQKFNISAVRFKKNAITCTCDTVWMNDWIRRQDQSLSSERNNYTCEHRGQRSRMVDVTWTSLVCYFDIAVGVCVSLGIVLCIIILITCICARYNYECKVLLFEYAHAHPFDKTPCDKIVDATKEHDIYVSIDRENDRIRLWVKDKLLPRLERKTKHHKGYKVYYPPRQDDFGDSIADQMIENINKSRRVIAVINSTYVQEGWSIEEFDHAHRLLEEANTGRLLVLIYGDLDIQKVTVEPLKSHLLGKQCFSLKDKWVWRKLRYDLPHQPMTERTSASRESLTSGVSSIHATLSEGSLDSFLR